MRYLDFQKAMTDFPVFSLADIRKAGDVSPMQLSRWQAKGYIQRLINGFYRFPTVLLEEQEYWYIANTIYAPSYVSCQTVLSQAGLIPEVVDVTVSMTARAPVRFETPVGRFAYHHCDPRLMFGYTVTHLGRPTEAPVRVAETEKAILDFLYLNPHLETPAAMEELRFNPLSWAEVRQDRLDEYLTIFDNKALAQRVHLLRTILHHASSL